jgi:hypothetical protein
LRIKAVSVNGTKAVVQIINQCKGSVPKSRILLRLYKGATKDSGEGSLIEFDVPALAGGGTASAEIDLKSPAGVSKTFVGKYYRFELDPNDKIKEMIEHNNWYEKEIQPFPDSITSCEPPKTPPPGSLSDLRITGVTIKGGQMYVEITNQCKGATAKTRLSLEIYGGPTKGSPGGIIFEADVPALDGETKKSVIFDLKDNAKFKTFDERYYRLEVDNYNNIKEASEGNNWKEKGAGPFPDDASRLCVPK